MLAALVLLALDAIVVFRLAGGFAQLLRRPQPPRQKAATTFTALMLLCAATLFAASARAQDDQAALKSTLETRLAYIVTGDAEADRVSKAGLQGLTMFLAQRTALEAGEPIGSSRPRRARLLSADLLTDRTRHGAASREALTRRRPADGRDDAVRHPRRGQTTPGNEARAPDMVALQHPLLAGPARTRAGAELHKC
jgi:hypothetical protein